jgi:hypothetical protein
MRRRRLFPGLVWLLLVGFLVCGLPACGLSEPDAEETAFAIAAISRRAPDRLVEEPSSSEEVAQTAAGRLPPRRVSIPPPAPAIRLLMHRFNE